LSRRCPDDASPIPLRRVRPPIDTCHPRATASTDAPAPASGLHVPPASGVRMRRIGGAPGGVVHRARCRRPTVDIFVWSPNSRLRCGERLVRLATARPKPSGPAEVERRPQTLVSPFLLTVDANGISHGWSRPKRRARWLAAVRVR
jgi:hypothetical protein